MDSSTFVRQKSPRGSDGGGDIIETAMEDEAANMAAMDYEQLMSYFESLKESSA